MIRAFHTVPGYDCVLASERCPKPPCRGWEHGRTSPKWIYSVHPDGDVSSALVLEVSTALSPYPDLPEVVAWWEKCALQNPFRRSARDLSLHVSWPTTEEDIRVGTHGEKDCLIGVPNCRIWDTSSLVGDERIYQPFGSMTCTDGAQSERFWFTLETFYWQWLDRARKERLDQKLCRCSGCGGRGVVVREHGRMTAADAVVVLRTYARKNETPEPASEAIGILVDHALRLEQALQLIGRAFTSAIADAPENAVLGVSTRTAKISRTP